MKYLGNQNSRCYNGKLLNHIILDKYKVPDGHLTVRTTSTAEEHRDYYNIQAFNCCLVLYVPNFQNFAL